MAEQIIFKNQGGKFPVSSDKIVTRNVPSIDDEDIIILELDKPENKKPKDKRKINNVSLPNPRI